MVLTQLQYPDRCVDTASVLDRIAREGPTARLSLAEATALVASRDMGEHDTERTARNRVRTRISRTLKASMLDADSVPEDDGMRLVLDGDGRIAVDELIRWATTIFGDRFGGLPRKTRNVNVRMRDGLDMGARPGYEHLSGSRELLEREVLQLRAENRQFKQDAASAEERRRKELGARFKN